MKLQSGETVFTLKELAECISFNKSEIGISRTMRQIRHWTQSDLLKTVTMKNTGKGIPRLYDYEPTPLIAAVLLELSRYGATVEIMRPVAKEFYSDWEEDNGYFLSLADTDIPALVQIVWQTDPATGEFCDADVRFMEEIPDRESSELHLSELDETASSSVLLNLTAINWRITGNEYPGRI